MEKLVGKVANYYKNIGVAAIELEGTLKVNDAIHIKGHTSDFTQNVASMQIDRESVSTAKPGQGVGVKVDQAVRQGDLVYVVSPPGPDVSPTLE